MNLHDHELVGACSAFIFRLTEFLGAGAATAKDNPNFLRIVIDDKKIDCKADIASTNGRYFFRNPEQYRRFYIPHADSPGIYFFFNKAGIALYVGKSEIDGGIGRRVSSHIGRSEGDEFPYLAFPEAQYVITVPFLQAPWLAPAFESFLLGRYSFSYNLSLAQRELAEPVT